MGGTTRKVTGQEDKRRANEAKQQAEMQAKKEKIKLQNERNEMARVAGESAAASRRSRRRTSLLGTVSLGSAEQTLGDELKLLG
jgi:hypothetical protein